MPSRSAKQKVVRKGHAKLIAANMAKQLDTPKHQHRMATTNRILPVGSLRRRCIQKVFAGWILDFVYKGRIITRLLSAEVCRRLRRKFQMQGGSDSAEINRLHVLLKCARKRQIVKPSKKRKPAMSSMDLLETLPLPDGGAVEDR